MIRLAILLAIGFAHSACSAQKQPGNATAAGESEVAADRAQGRDNDRSVSSNVTESRILISSERGAVRADLIDNSATRALLRMLPVTIEMRDHLRQEKTGNLPSSLPVGPRQTEFSAGTLGLWGDDDLVVYYRNGRVPPPGIIVLGDVTGDLGIFEGTQSVTVRIEKAD